MIKYLIKFVSKEQYAEDLLDGKLFMYPAGHYHTLKQGRGDIREGALHGSARIYKNIDYPIFCLTYVSESSIVEGNIRISKNIIEDFDCQNGYLVLIDFSEFSTAIKACDTEGYTLCGKPVSYGNITIENTKDLLLSEDPLNLFIKHPYFKHQNEYRFVICRGYPPTPKEKSFVENEPYYGYDPVIYKIPSIRNIGYKYAIDDLCDDGDNLIIVVDGDNNG